MTRESEFIVAIGLFCFVCGIIILLVLFGMKCFTFSRDNTVSTSMISFAILASILYALSSLFSGLYWICIIGYINNVLFKHFCDLFQIFCWHLGQVMVYFYLLIRLYMGFKGTVHSIQRSTSCSLCILLCLYLFACLIVLSELVWYIIWYSTESINDPDNFPYHDEFVYTYKSIALAVDLLLSIALLWIFINKLRKISESLNAMIDNDHDLSSNENSHNDSALVNERKTLETQNENIQTVMAKVLVLGILLVIISQIVLILSLLNWIINSVNDNIFTIIYAWLKGFHTFMASLSVFLGFEFTHNWYNCCCGPCHKIMKRSPVITNVSGNISHKNKDSEYNTNPV